MSCARGNGPISTKFLKKINEKLKVSIPRCLPGSFSWILIGKEKVFLSSSVDSPLIGCAHNILRVAESTCVFSESACQTKNSANTVIAHFSGKGTILSIVQFSGNVRYVLAVLSHHVGSVNESSVGEEDEKDEKDSKDEEEGKGDAEKKKKVPSVPETEKNEQPKEGDAGTSKEDQNDKNSKTETATNPRKFLIPGCPSSTSPEGAAFSKSTDELRSLVEELLIMFQSTDHSKSATMTERRASSNYGTSPLSSSNPQLPPVSSQTDPSSTPQASTPAASGPSTGSSGLSQTSSKPTTDDADTS